VGATSVQHGAESVEEVLIAIPDTSSAAQKIAALKRRPPIIVVIQRDESDVYEGEAEEVTALPEVTVIGSEY
jgi:hypothetical protein